jgi:hypothetical protein
MNHGAGLQKAMDNTEEHTKRLLEEWGKGHPGESIKIIPQQRELFVSEIAV